MLANLIADAIIWGNNYTVLLNFRHRISREIESGLRYFLEEINDKEYLDHELESAHYFKAKDLLGEPAFVGANMSKYKKPLFPDTERVID